MMKMLLQGKTGRRNAHLIAACMLSILISACDRAAVVANVDGTSITADQLLAEAAQRGLPASEAVLTDLLDTIIDREAAAVKAEAMDLLSEPDFRQAYNTLILETLRNRDQASWESELTITDIEIKAEYEHDIARFTRPEQRRIALIAFEGGVQRDSALPIAQNSLAQLKASGPGDARMQLFQSMAVQYSTHRGSRYRGGDVGFIQKGPHSQWPEVVVAAAFSLSQPGEISELIDADNSIYVLQLIAVEPSRTQPLASVSESIRQRLTTARFDALKRRSKARLRENVEVRTYPDVVASISSHESLSSEQPPAGPVMN